MQVFFLAEPGHLPLGKAFDGAGELVEHLLIGPLAQQVFGEKAVFQAKLFQKFRADAGVHESLDFLDHALVQAPFQAFVDTLLQYLPGPGDAQLQDLIAGIPPPGMVVVRRQAFQRAHDAVAVLGVDLRVRQLFLEHVVQGGGFKGLQIRAQFQIRLNVRQLVPVDHRVHIQPGAAHQEGQLSAGEDAVDRGIRQALKIRHGKKVPRLAYVDQMMWHALCFLRRDFSAAQIQPPEYLPGIGGHHFSVVHRGQFDPQPAFSRGVGAHDGNQFSLHVSFLPVDSGSA